MMQKSAKSLKIQENNCLTLLREQKTDNYVFTDTETDICSRNHFS